MAEYSSLKVPELKKLLAEKGLPQTGNKADLIARLQENDQKDEPDAKPAEKEDEINYSDDEAEAPAPVPAAPAPAAEPAAEAPATEAAPAAAEETTEAPAEEKPAEEEEKPSEPAPSFALGLSSTAAEEEAKKRADRAKRFGIQEDDDAKKRAERATRFGIDEKELASGLDSALPERTLKRGRDRVEGDGNRPGKRQSLDRRSGGRRRGGRGGRGGRDGGRDGARDGAPARDGGAKRSGRIVDDPEEKAKAERRAARFASS